jgi:hypothetical protein
MSDNEREQIEWVFSLTGGELSDKAWSYIEETAALSTDSGWFEADEQGRTKHADDARRRTFRYWYDGAPEYTEREHTDRGCTTDEQGRAVRTAVVCALYGMPPEILWDEADGSRWKRVEFYSSSGETDCPGQHEVVNKVTREHARLTAKLPSHIKSPTTGKPYPRRAECVLCGERIGSPHGFIYLGDGWGEAVYVQETPTLEFEIIDHGCDGEQYFPGCGVAFSKFTDVVTGIGESAREAGEDALSMLETDLSTDALEEAVNALSKDVDTARDEDTSDEWHHYVSIRYRVDKH